MKLPRVDGKQTIDALQKKGFVIQRIHGSHYILKSPDSRLRVTVPLHRKELAPKTLQSILKQAGISVEDFLSLL